MRNRRLDDGCRGIEQSWEQDEESSTRRSGCGAKVGGKETEGRKEGETKSYVLSERERQHDLHDGVDYPLVEGVRRCQHHVQSRPLQRQRPRPAPPASPAHPPGLM